VQKVYEPLREAARDSAGSSPFIPAPYASLPQEIRAAYATQAREIADLLRQHAATLVAHSSLQTFDWALETAEVISQFTLYADLRGTNPNAAFSYHEQSSAANAAWCHDHWGKSIVWAHDCHVAKNTPLLGIYPDKTMGSVLRDQFGDNYLSIGTSFGQGAYLAIKPNAPGATHEIDTIRVGAPAPNSTTAVLNQAGGELFLLDLRQAPAPVRLWLELPRPIRIGAMFTPGDPEWTAKYTTLNASLGKWFDVIVHLRRVTAGHAYSPAVR
jgi:erythromycin esterase